MTSSNTIPKQADNTETKENDSKELASRQSSVQYSSLLSEINSKREQIHNKSLKQKSGSSRNTSPKKEAEHPEVIYSNAHETTYMNTTGMYDGGSPLDSRAADIVFQLDKIIRDNQSNGVATAFRDSAQSAHSVETDDDEAQLIRSKLYVLVIIGHSQNKLMICVSDCQYISVHFSKIISIATICKNNFSLFSQEATESPITTSGPLLPGGRTKLSALGRRPGPRSPPAIVGLIFQPDRISMKKSE